MCLKLDQQHHAIKLCPGDRIRLTGLGTYSAAMHCAQVSAGERAVRRAQLVQDLLHLPPTAFPAIAPRASISESGSAPSAAAPGTPRPRPGTETRYPPFYSTAPISNRHLAPSAAPDHAWSASLNRMSDAYQEDSYSDVEEEDSEPLSSTDFPYLGSDGTDEVHRATDSGVLPQQVDVPRVPVTLCLPPSRQLSAHEDRDSFSSVSGRTLGSSAYATPGTLSPVATPTLTPSSSTSGVAFRRMASGVREGGIMDSASSIANMSPSRHADKSKAARSNDASASANGGGLIGELGFSEFGAGESEHTWGQLDLQQITQFPGPVGAAGTGGSAGEVLQLGERSSSPGSASFGARFADAMLGRGPGGRSGRGWVAGIKQTLWGRDNAGGGR